MPHAITRRRSFGSSARSLAVLGLLIAAGTLPGCAQRSLLAVQQSGERAYQQGDFERAQSDFQEYVDRRPGDPIGHYNLGRAYLKTSPPHPGMAREQLMVAYAQLDQKDEVLESLCEAYIAAHQNEELFKFLRGRAMDRQQVSDYVRLAKYAQKLGDVDEARTALLTAAKIDGGQSCELQLTIADFFTSVGDREKARQRLQMAYYLDPNNTRVQERIRANGEVPGPTFALKPEELP